VIDGCYPRQKRLRKQYRGIGNVIDGEEKSIGMMMANLLTIQCHVGLEIRSCADKMTVSPK
jgi:hypothetical protein